MYGSQWDWRCVDIWTTMGLEMCGYVDHNGIGDEWMCGPQQDCSCVDCDHNGILLRLNLKQ